MFRKLDRSSQYILYYSLLLFFNIQERKRFGWLNTKRKPAVLEAFISEWGKTS